MHSVPEQAMPLNVVVTVYGGEKSIFAYQVCPASVVLYTKP
jgi:hypothetical protein